MSCFPSVQDKDITGPPVLWVKKRLFPVSAFEGRGRWPPCRVMTRVKMKAEFKEHVCAPAEQVACKIRTKTLSIKNFKQSDFCFLRMKHSWKSWGEMWMNIFSLEWEKRAGSGRLHRQTSRNGQVAKWLFKKTWMVFGGCECVLVAGH